MRVLITGATGFTGSFVVPRLLERDLEVHCLVRTSSDTRPLPLERLRLVEGDLSDRQSLQRAMSGMDALVNMASLGFGHAPNLVDSAEQAGVRRAVFLSTTAIYTTLNPGSRSIRLAAEETIGRCRVPCTILRPTMIYGSPRDRNMFRLIRYLQRWPVVPVIGDGQSLQQPVYVEDVSDAVVRCLETDLTAGRAYNVPGGSPLTFDQVVDTVCEALGRSVRKVHVPVEPVAAMMRLLERLSIRLPVSSEQVKRLNEDKVFDYSEAENDFGYRPRSFREGIRLELRAMKLI